MGEYARKYTVFASFYVYFIINGLLLSILFRQRASDAAGEKHRETQQKQKDASRSTDGGSGVIQPTGESAADV